MFERFVLLEQDYLEIGRRYIQALGIHKGISAAVEDMNAGRLPWDKAWQVLGHMTYLAIEHIAQRVGFTRFSTVYTDPEFVALQVNRLSMVLQRNGPFPEARYVRALEDFAWQALRHWHLVAHDLGGRHAYKVTPVLANLLRQPDSLEKPWQTPRLPVSSLLVRVPPEAGITLGDAADCPHAVTEIYVVEAVPPQHQWSVWIHAPIDPEFAESLYLEIPMPSEGSLEEGLERAHDMFRGGAPTSVGWKECVRWLAAAMRHLAEGGSLRGGSHLLQ
ncbi:hypothetical protein [Hyalangium rubrum]|uniref:Uncharacterized protein n=1 Tax=Hyalangium rubrum TaxID=3103134 RepID=A0ABU5HHD6_9BACT|nr:hypothetical protein [Hyalangium sp. s54d21]MDY7232242.1 hypothetical protein [Hyalangium sp. s54d21]